MTNAELMTAIVESLKDPVLVADTGHTVRYMNPAAIAHYDEGEALLGSSLLDCHTVEQGRVIVEIMADMQTGLEERLITDNEKHRIFMRAVRDGSGQLLGYYERYEPPAK